MARKHSTNQPCLFSDLNANPGGNHTKITHKACSRCGGKKPLDQFHNDTDRKDGKQRDCKECSKEIIRAVWKSPKLRGEQSLRVWARNIKTLYGMTAADYQKLLDQQDSRCGICRKTAEEVKRNGYNARFDIDHNPATGIIRGLLCSSCNLGLGKFFHRTDLLHKAITYLETKDK